MPSGETKVRSNPMRSSVMVSGPLRPSGGVNLDDLRLGGASGGKDAQGHRTDVPALAKSYLARRPMGGSAGGTPGRLAAPASEAASAEDVGAQSDELVEGETEVVHAQVSA